MGKGARARTERLTVVRLTVVRPAEPDDLDALVAIENDSFSDPWSRHALALAVTNVHTVVMVAELGPGASAEPGNESASREGEGDAEGERVAGYFVLSPIGDEAELLNLAVSRQSRRRGTGAALVQHAVREAAARGARAVFLEVRESNVAARALYASAGFDQVGRRKGYYERPTEDALILRKVIGTGY